MATSISETQIESWLTDLTQAESKDHEFVARAISKTPTYDERIVTALMEIARSDPKGNARGAAKAALENIAGAHFSAGNEIRAYLEQLRAGTLKPPVVAQAEPKPALLVEAEALLPNSERVAPEPQPLVAATALSPETKPRIERQPTPVSPPSPPAPQIPFDQWLLSERNIKLALYAGGFLLLLAGLIFVTVNWAYLPGIAKLGVTLAVTLVMYAGGFALFNRPSLKIGGAALLAIGSSFLPLNFVVTHLYLTGERGVSAEAMWLVASLVCGAVYVATTLWTRHNLFTVLSLVALLSSLTAGMRLAAFQGTLFALGYSIITLFLLFLAYRSRSSAHLNFVSRPLRLAAHILAPLVFLISVSAWFISSNVVSALGNRWLALLALLLMVAFYVLDNWRTHSSYARWCAAIAFAVVAILFYAELRLSTIQTGLALKGLALLYLVGGYRLQRGKKLGAGLPLYVVAALLAAFVTSLSVPVSSKTPEHLALALAGDVVLLAVAAYLFRRVEFVHAAAWLGIAPLYIFANLYVRDHTGVALVLSALMLIYAAAGYFIGRERLRWGGAFLSAAALLSGIVTILLLPDLQVLTGVLLGVSVLYVLSAVWLRWRWLTLAGLAALNLAVITGILSRFTLNVEFSSGFTLAYGVLGIVLLAVAVELKRRGLARWSAPLYLVAAFDLGIAFVLSLARSDGLSVVMSAVVALVCFAMAWVERAAMRRMKLPPVLAYLGGLVTLNGIYYATLVLNVPREFAPAALTLVSALFIFGALGLRRADPDLSAIYGAPLRYIGFFAMGWMLFAELIVNHPATGALTYAIAAVALGADGLVWKQIGVVYASGASVVGVILWLVRSLNVTEAQAYVIPMGALCLLVGWSELRRGKAPWFQLASLLGLVILLGSAFSQSLSNVVYAGLLLLESVAAFGVGLKMRSRLYVEAGILALVGNGLAQFGPAFLQLSPWVHLGAVGSILLVAGLAALFRRQTLLEARRALTSGWRMWKP